MLILCLTSLVHVGLGELIYLVMILLNNPIIEKKQFPVWFYYLRLKNTTVSSRNTPNLWHNVDYLTLRLSF